MADPSLVRIVLLGNDPADQQWSMLQCGKHLEEALQKIAPEGKQYTHLNPNARLQGSFWRRRRIGRSSAMYISRYIFYPRLLQGIQGDLFHILDHGNSCLIRHLEPGRTVVTCHDLIPLVLRHQSDSPFPWFSEMAYRSAVSGLSLAAKILAVSETTKNDLMRLLQIPSHRIEVVPNGIGSFFRPPSTEDARQRARSEFNLPDGALLLHIGQPLLYKNIEGILRTLKILQQKDAPCWLVRVGGSLRKNQARLADQLGVTDRIIQLGWLSQERLVRAYHAADILLFPSWYEGFGLPPLEAMASGLPVIVSNRGSLPETAGDAALRVRPDSPEEMAEAVRRILSDEQLRKDLRARGLRQAAQFTWEKTARQTLEVYKSVLACYTFDQKRRNPR